MLTPQELQDIRTQLLGGGLGDSNGLSWSVNSGALIARQDTRIPDSEQAILRELAKRVANVAAQSEQQAKLRLWQRHNALEQTQPLVFCDPESAWHEIFPAKTLLCTTPLARIWEFKLKKELYWADVIQDDRPILPRLAVQTAYTLTSRGMESVKHGDLPGQAYHWDAPLSDPALLDALVPQRICVDREKTQSLLQCAHDIFDGILDVREEGVFWWSFGLTGDVITLRGFEQMFLDMYDNPDFLHRIMAFLRDEALQKLDFLEKNGHLTPNSGVDFIGTGGYGYIQSLPVTGAGVKLTDMWGFCESQETVSVSPACFAEFIFPYQLEILKRFALNIYGCCEPIENRWDTISTIPRLRRVTVSPWSDEHLAAEQLGKDYVYVRKINPSYMAVPMLAEDPARKQLRDTFEAAYANSCPVEVLLRDVTTLGGNPDNAVRWTRLAREEAARVYDH